MRKNKKITSCVCIIFIFISAMACDNFQDLNTPKTVLFESELSKNQIGKMFAKAEYRGFFLDGASFQVMENLNSDLYSQYFATAADYFSTDRFVYVPGWIQTGWTSFYTQAAPQLKYVEDYTADHDLPIENAATKILKVALYQRMTDYFGPIIYSHFGNGKTSVPYDSQKEIYMDFFKELDKAVAVLQQHHGGSVFPSNDLIYSHPDNVGQWLKYANSLRLRAAMRIVYADPKKAKKEAEKAIKASGGVINSNSDNASVRINKQAQSVHAYISRFGEYRMSAALVSALKGYKDPRLSVYMNQAKDGGGYHGLRNGLPKIQIDSKDMDKYSFIDTKLRAPSEGGIDPPWHVMDASEVYFLRAEGALRGWNMGGSARELYNEGIRASLKKETNATSSEIDAYINSSNTPVALNDDWNSPPVFNIPVKFETGASFQTKLQQIISQKWLALYPNGWEAWAERRRTGYPHLYPLIKSGNIDIPADAIIRRMKFVQTEYQNNNKAVKKAIQFLHPSKDGLMSRVWWDANPNNPIRKK